MILENLTIKGAAGEKQIIIQSGQIKAIHHQDSNTKDTNDTRIEFENAIAFPGLINSHDHLDFNLFPLLANRTYTNYAEWAHDIQQKNKKTIDEVLNIPESVRIEWGCYKNLLNGFTTVVNHGKRIMISNELISVFQDSYPLHSTTFEKNWKGKLNNPFQSSKPYVMHIGEGTDAMAKNEIANVLKWNWFKKKIVAVHGIAMDKEQAAAFKGLVWCPASNYMLIGETIDIQQLRRATAIVFGTDSTLSTGWNAWEHFRQARIGEDELMEMLTTTPAGLWGLNDVGAIKENATADIVVKNKTADFFSTNPEDILLVMHKGNIRLFDETLASQLQELGNTFSRVKINNSTKFVEGDLPALIKQIRSYSPNTILPVA